MVKTFRVNMWYGITARGAGSRQGASAAYDQYTVTRKFPARDLNEVQKTLEADATRMYPRLGRLKLWRVKVEVV